MPVPLYGSKARLYANNILVCTNPVPIELDKLNDKKAEASLMKIALGAFKENIHVLVVSVPDFKEAYDCFRNKKFVEGTCQHRLRRIQGKRKLYGFLQRSDEEIERTISMDNNSDDPNLNKAKTAADMAVLQSQIGEYKKKLADLQSKVYTGKIQGSYDPDAGRLHRCGCVS
ncbi:MAG: hypothetical protein LKE52_04405 [Bacilli bacterium]|nr:hypothetical protein [Bacilli bacterium]